MRGQRIPGPSDVVSAERSANVLNVRGSSGTAPDCYRVEAVFSGCLGTRGDPPLGRDSEVAPFASIDGLQRILRSGGPGLDLDKGNRGSITNDEVDLVSSCTPIRCENSATGTT